MFKYKSKYALVDFYTEKCKMSCENCHKATLYKYFKTEIKFEKYLTVLPNELSIYMCRYRISSHLLPIEKGRHTGKARNERLCDLCQNEIGDEFHYLLVCPKVEDKRKELIPKYYSKRPNMQKYVDLLNSKNPKILRKVATFIKIIMKLN